MKRNRSSASGLGVARALRGSMIASGMSSCTRTIDRSRVMGATRTLRGWMLSIDIVSLIHLISYLSITNSACSVVRSEGGAECQKALNEAQHQQNLGRSPPLTKTEDNGWPGMSVML